jgi:hypothetical protein
VLQVPDKDKPMFIGLDVVVIGLPAHTIHMVDDSTLYIVQVQDPSLSEDEPLNLQCEMVGERVRTEHEQ